MMMTSKSPVPPLVFPDRSKKKQPTATDTDDNESGASPLHTPQPLTSHSTSSAVLEISYISGRSSVTGHMKGGGGGASVANQKRSVLYYEQPPKPLSGSLYAPDGSFAYGSHFTASGGGGGGGGGNKSQKKEEEGIGEKAVSGNVSSRAGSVAGTEGYDSSPRTSLWSVASASNYGGGSTHSTARVQANGGSATNAQQQQQQLMQKHNSASSMKDISATPWENSRSLSYPEGDEWVCESDTGAGGDDVIDDELKPYLSSDEEEDIFVRHDDDDDHGKNEEWLVANSTTSPDQQHGQELTNPSRSKQTLETAEKVRASLMQSEIDSAYETCDCSLLMELLAIARTMPKGVAAIHVLSRILDLLNNYDKEEERKKKLKLNEVKRGIDQSVVNQSIKSRFGAEPPQQQQLRELLADASCAEGCVETILAFPHHWKVQAAVTRVLSALLKGANRYACFLCV
jgi:hypothetical protein